MHDEKLSNRDLKFKGKVLDNVHGFIYYTEAEERIMDTLLFKRLQSIKQLSIVNWVFPGSEHTRYIHSLGVMYIADKIAIQLELSNDERRIIRMAGLVHDIGHYPLSHVCELPYKKNLEDFPDSDYYKIINEQTKSKIGELSDVLKFDYMAKSTGCHHEQIGADIVLNNDEIKSIIVDECGEKAPQTIADMITGNIERTEPLLVQILHSELDADGIDYLMRDAMFSGTSFGVFELDQLIGSMCIGEIHGKRTLCISEKGIAAADQYLINKFFSYSQVVCNKHVSITEWMAEQIVNWMQKNNKEFPKASILKNWVCCNETNEIFLNFTDTYFWAALKKIYDDACVDNEYIKKFCLLLLHHSELEFEEASEVKFIATSKEMLKNEIIETEEYKNMDIQKDRISIFSERRMSKQIPYDTFKKIVERTIEKEKKENSGESTTEEKKDEYETDLFMECITVKDVTGVHLLCDDKRSLMQSLYSNTLGVIRTYKYS